jgi:chromate transporter
VLAYVAQQAVQTYGWLAPGEMLDGLGMAESTPGPLIMVVQFVGFMGAYRAAEGLDPLLAGVVGAVIVTWVTFAPCFLWIFLGAPYIEHLRGNRSLATALSSITAAIVGVILNLAVWFSLHTIFERVDEVRAFGVRLHSPEAATVDPLAAALAVGAFYLLAKRKWAMLPTLGLSVAIGTTIHLAGLT